MLTKTSRSKNFLTKIYFKLFNRWKSIQSLIFFFLFFLVIFISLLISISSLNYIKFIMDSNFDKLSFQIAQNFSYNCKENLIIEDLPRLKTDIIQLFSESSVIYSSIYSKNNTLIIENSRNKRLSNKILPYEFTSTTNKTHLIFNDQNSLKIQIPISYEDNYIGSIIVIFTHQEIENKLFFVFLNYVFLFFIILILSIIFSYIIAKSIATPLKITTKHMEELAKGNYSLEIPTNLLSRSDEFLNLITSIKIMQSKTSEFINQLQLIEKEKLTSLGQLVNGVAHEVNTPVGVCITAASLLNIKTNQLSHTLSSNSGLKKSVLVEYIEKNKEICNIILANLDRTSQIILSFKSVAVDQTSEEKRIFNVSDYINQILISQTRILKKHLDHITIDCPQDLTINSYPGALSQILSNFILNSFQYAFTQENIGKIVISVSKNKNNITLIYKDDGKGIKEENLKKIFNPFFTTNMSSGSGLGLYLVYNIVTHLLNGTISCISKENIGTIFKIEFNEN